MMDEKTYINDQTDNLIALFKLEANVLDGKYIDGGICANVPCPEHFHQHYPSWKHFSRDYGFPVPYITKHIPNLAKPGFDRNTGQLWANTRYGTLRRELVQHLIQSIIKELSLSNEDVEYLKEWKDY